MLRDYQTSGKAQVYAEWARLAPARGNVLYQLPTGGGKSVIASDMVGENDRQRGQSAVIAHRQELVSQMSLHVARAGVYHRIIAPDNVRKMIIGIHRKEFGRSYVDPTARTGVVGIDTLNARRDELAGWARQCNLWVMDEAHHVLRGNKWGKGLELFPNAYGLGFTATPGRPDGQGLGRHADGVFDSLITGPSMRHLIEIGALTDYELVLPSAGIDLSRLHITDSGDYSPKDLKEFSANGKIVGDIVAQYCIWAYGKRGITFATDIDAAVEIAERFTALGIPAAALSYKTKDDVRFDYIDRFRSGKLLQLVNVDMLGEGFDVPAVEVVSMGRPTASLVVYQQQGGRAFRPFEGKRYGLIIDHVDNYKLFGLLDRARVWSLDRRDKRAKRERDPEDIPVRKCSNCQRGYMAIFRSCPYCGHIPVPEGGGRSVEQVDGDLMLLDAATLAKLRAGTVLETPASLHARVARAAGPGIADYQVGKLAERAASQAALDDAIALWAGYQRHAGRPDSESYRRFYFAAGMDVASALSMDRADMDAMRERVLSWI